MAEKFDPAAHDKHAGHPREAALADGKMHARLETGLIHSFRHPIPRGGRREVLPALIAD